MKTIINTYKVFYPTLLSGVTFLLAPILLILFFLFIGDPKLGAVILLIGAVMIGYYGLVQDYVAFMGICSRNSSMRIFRSSYRGKQLLKRGLIQDQLRRFFQIQIVMLVLGVLCEKILYTGKETYLLGVLLGLVVYIFTTASTNGLRYFVHLNVYFMIATLVVVLETLGMVFLYLQLMKGQLSYPVCLIVALVLAIVVSVISIKHVLYRYELGFFDKE